MYVKIEFVLIDQLFSSSIGHVLTYIWHAGLGVQDYNSEAKTDHDPFLDSVTM